KDVKIIVSRAGKTVATLKPASVDAGVNRIVWDFRADRPVPATPQEEEAARRAEAAGGPPPKLGGPLCDPGEYTVEGSIGTNKDSKRFRVEDDPRITWFTSADRTKRRAAIDELAGLMKQVDAQRKKFNAADASVTSLQTAWKRPDAAKVPDDVKKQA